MIKPRVTWYALSCFAHSLSDANHGQQGGQAPKKWKSWNSWTWKKVLLSVPMIPHFTLINYDYTTIVVGYLTLINHDSHVVFTPFLRDPISQDNSEFHAAIAGAVSGAYHARAVAEQYGVPVILHTDHCAKKLLPWFDGLLEAGWGGEILIQNNWGLNVGGVGPFSFQMARKNFLVLFAMFISIPIIGRTIPKWLAFFHEGCFNTHPNMDQ